jgi:hypothetical protein
LAHLLHTLSKKQGGNMIHRYQREILLKAKELFPNYKLKDWSKHTGIQLTRIFRLFHGKEMSLSEYMAFHNYISKDKNQTFGKSFDEFSSLSQKSLEHLPSTLIEQINLNLKYHLENFFILQGKVKELY